MTICYVLWQFPILSETFITREVIGLMRQGLDIRLFSLYPPQAGDRVPGEAESLAAQTVYASRTGGMLAHYAWLRSAPRTYLSSWRTMLSVHAGSSSCLRRSIRIWLRAADLAWQAAQLGVSHFHAHFGSLPTSAALGMAQLLGASFSFSVHGRDLHVPDPALTQKIARARFVLACSQHGRQIVQRRAPAYADRIILHYHGLSLQPLPPQSPAGQPLIVAVGRLVAKKGFTYLIQASALLKANGVAIRTVIIGDGPERAALAAQIEARNLHQEVTLYGPLAIADVWPWYARASMLVAPACVGPDGDQDGIPNVILEALLCARPVVASAVGGIPEVIQHFHTGLLVPSASPQALAAAIQWVLGHPAQALQFAQRGHALVSERFSLEQSSRRLAGIFRSYLQLNADQPPDQRAASAAEG